jgi:hypothetical protein
MRPLAPLRPHRIGIVVQRTGNPGRFKIIKFKTVLAVGTAGTRSCRAALEALPMQGEITSSRPKPRGAGPRGALTAGAAIGRFLEEPELVTDLSASARRREGLSCWIAGGR